MDSIQLNNLADNDSPLWEVFYNYNYMHGCPDQPSLPFIAKIQSQIDINGRPTSWDLPAENTPKFDLNSFSLHPADAGLAWHTSINVLRQNRHWKSAVGMANLLLKLFASDEAAGRAFGHTSKSYADVAQAEIGCLGDSWSRFCAYMYPAADHTRLELISATIVFIMIFDDIWEMNDEETIEMIKAEFISRLKVADIGSMEGVTPLQALIGLIMQRFHNEDLRKGNGGVEVIERLLEFFHHPPPLKEFKTLREFLDYRIEDAGMPYTLACVKFSLCSSVDITSPRIARLVSLASDHVCYANDLASFDKEKEAYVNGEVLYMINAVDMVQKVLNLPNDHSAKSATLTLQLQIENQIMDELSRLRSSTEVTSEELEFVEAVIYVLVGNIFSSVVMSRYGAERSRIPT